MLALFSLVATLAAVEEPIISLLPLIHQLQHENGNLLPVHPQQSTSARRMRRLVETGNDGTLNRANTAPLRIKVDTASLLESNMQPDNFLKYTACFEVGQWFRRGLPDNQPDPPSNGIETCQRGPGESLSVSGCWGRCLAGDLITVADMQKIHDVVETLAEEMSGLLAAIPEDQLTFVTSSGTYARALQSKGYPTPSVCAADCRSLSGVAVNPDYCGGGLGHGSDVILSVTKPPGVAGVAGTGSACATDQAGRPLWIVLAWHSSIVGIASESTSSLVNRHRGFVLHEILHGLGFVNSQFNYARDGNGHRKHLLQLRAVYDADFYLQWRAVGTSAPSTGSALSNANLASALAAGTTQFSASQWSGFGVSDVRDDSYIQAGSTYYAPAVTDEVWFFVKGRAYELAQLYFGCGSNSTGESREWDGLPLMGLPEAGRGAHWETRIMRDDVMSYGFQPHVSSITLAAMEDLGFYLANYSAAGCMSWGRQQGCAYVNRRCGVQIHDGSAYVLNDGNGRDRCSGDPFWGRTSDPYLAARCSRGIDPCDTRGDANFELSVSCPPGSTDDPTATCSRCNAQCAMAPIGGRDDCALSPSTDPDATTGSVLDDLRSRLSSIDWEAWLIPLIYLLGFILVFSIVRGCICPAGNSSRTIAFFLLVVVGLLAAGMVAGTALLYTRREMYQAFVGFNTIVVCGAIGVTLLVFCFVEGYALLVKHEFFLRLGFWALLLLCLIEVLVSFLVSYWVYSLGAIPSDTLNSLFGDSKENIDTFLADILERPLSVAEGLVCKTYQKCCRDPNLDLVVIQDIDYGSGTFEAGSGGATHSAPATNATQATCLEPGMHSSFNDLDAAMRDPSNENFCPYSSGAPAYLLNEPPGGICNVIEQLQAASGGSWSVTECQAAFCAEGTDGYLAFVTMFVELLQRYAFPMGITLSVLVVLQLILAFNLRTAGKLARQDRQANRMKKDYELRYRTPTYTENV